MCEHTNKYYHNDKNEHVNMTEIQKYNKYYHNDENEHVNMTEILIIFSYFGHIHLHFGQVHSLTFFSVNFNVKVCRFRSNSNQFLVILIRSSYLASSF